MQWTLNAYPKWVWGAVAGVALILVIGHWQNERVSFHEQRAKELGQQVQALQAQLKQDDADLQKAHQAVQQAKEATSKGRVVYQAIRVPAKPPTPPTANPEIQAGLVAMGLAKGLVVTDNLQSALAHQDALKVYEWGQEVQRVPALEAKVAAGQDLIDTQDHQIQTLNNQSQVQQRTIQDGQRALTVQSQQVKELEKAITVRKLEGWKKWAYGAAGVAVGIVVSKHH